VAANVLRMAPGAERGWVQGGHVTVEGGNRSNPHLKLTSMDGNGGNIIAHERTTVATPHASGRWPANLIHDGSDEVVRLFPQTRVSGRQFRAMQNEAQQVELQQRRRLCRCS
jgi:hypothetical protein